MTPDFRVAAAALAALPTVVSETSALAIVSRVLESCTNREYGAAKEGPVCIYTGRDNIRESCARVLGAFRNDASLAIAERELKNVAGAVGGDPEQLAYGSRLVALIRASGNPPGAPILDRYADGLRSVVVQDGGQKVALEAAAREAREAAHALRGGRPTE